MGEKIKVIKFGYNKSGKKLEAGWNEFTGTRYYNYQFYANRNNPDESLLKQGITPRCEAVLQRLISGQKIFFRVRTIGVTGLGEWSGASFVQTGSSEKDGAGEPEKSALEKAEPISEKKYKHSL